MNKSFTKSENHGRLFGEHSALQHASNIFKSGTSFSFVEFTKKKNCEIPSHSGSFSFLLSFLNVSSPCSTETKWLCFLIHYLFFTGVWDALFYSKHHEQEGENYKGL